ncbi:alphaK I8 [Puccinia sorghi]|uniref:AlphaK I8 n=1 Tax=Puccinia sorghi TaxID=27349 RepID=A0A0L6VAD0_9BASI|nr:alphaK I8 [Puccinia sorghi]
MSVALPMVRCVKCKKWSAGPHFAGWCRLRLVFMCLDPDSNPSFSAVQSNPLNVIQPPNGQASRMTNLITTKSVVRDTSR